MGSVLSRVSSRSPLPLPSPSPCPSPSPSPSPRPEIKYDVFLSFRGDDTRNNFTSHLYKAFQDKGIAAFIDYQLRRGDEISPSLLQAIQESQISLVIFSKNFADSRWCLEELVKILECKKNHQQIVIPVFYKIDPTHVRHQTGSYAVAFDNHEQRFNEDLDKVQKWRDALKEAANLSGFDSRFVVPETVLVEKIIEAVLESLDNMPSSDNKQLVEIESKIREIEVMLGMGDQMNNDVRRVGIWGIGGIGKTTLARAVYNKISHQFEHSHFMENVREDLKKMGAKCLRQELYLAILGDENVCNHLLIKKRFSRMKLLIILDDVSSINEVDYLFGDLDCFGSGSRIIITSRDQQALKCCEVDSIYKVKELSSDNAVKLFSQHAFKQNYPKVDDMELSTSVVQKVGGVPLALKVLGCFLRDKKKEVWESSMKKLENSLDKDIYDKLKISYDGLDLDQQRVFLDIAHFYKGWDVDLVIAIMDANGFCTDNELSALEDKCLIIKSRNKLMMHDLLQAMGKRIVRQESIDPGERTRLCNYDDISDVLTNATGTKKIEGISLDMSNTGDIYLHPDAFIKMSNLKFLRVYTSNYLRCNNNKMHVPQDFRFHLTKLRYFQWERCPLKSLQSNLHIENLVILNLCRSNIEQLWNGVQQFNYLKKFVIGSRKLIRFPNLKAPRLECLHLGGCTSLIEMPSSFQHLSRLMSLSLVSCENLTSVPQLPKNLEKLCIRNCYSLIEIPSSIQHLTRLSDLDLSGCKLLTSIPDCTGLISLQSLVLYSCSKLKRLPEIPNNIQAIYLQGYYSSFEIPSFVELLNKGLPEFSNNLQRLSLINCGITEIPDSVSYLTSLTHLMLDGNKFERIPESIINLSKLASLDIRDCRRLKVLPKLPWACVDACGSISLQELSCPSFPNDFKFHLTKLRYFQWERCPLKSLQSNLHMRNLVILSLCDITIEQLWSGIEAPQLELLDLDGCESLIEMPSSFQHLSRLMALPLYSCENLMSVPQLPSNLVALDLGNCCSLIEIPSSIQHLTRLFSLDLTCCKLLTSIPDCTGLISLERLNLSSCSRLKRLPEFPNNIREIYLQGYESPLSLLGTKSCSKPQVLSEFSNNLPELSPIECGITVIPDSVCYLTSLLHLELDGNKFERIAESIINLSKLAYLNIRDCKRLKVLPKLPWARVDACGCISLQELSCPSFPNDFFGIDSNRSAKFFSCFKLDRNSLNSFVKDVQREIEAQSPPYRQVYDGKSPNFHIAYPSREIPEYFDFQSTGSFINVKLSPDWFNYNFLCFALCSVVSYGDQLEVENVVLTSPPIAFVCSVKSKESGHNRNQMNSSLARFCVCPKYYSTRASDVIIGFGFHFLRELHDNEFTFEFYSPIVRKQDYKVEKCGVHLICGKHLEKSDQNEEVDESHSEESKEDDEPHLEELNEEDEPHPKRLKHI